MIEFRGKGERKGKRTAEKEGEILGLVRRLRSAWSLGWMVEG